MSATLPFVPITASASGLTVIVAACASGTLDSTSKFAPVILVANNLASNMCWVRLTPSTQAGVATTNDIPVGPGRTRLFANPMPTGQTACSVTATLTTSGLIYFCPGQGGVV